MALSRAIAPSRSGLGPLVSDLFDLDEVKHLLDHPTKRGRVRDNDLRARTAEAEPMDHAARVLNLTDRAAALTDSKKRLHGVPPSP
jgi:hypothetical protein